MIVGVYKSYLRKKRKNKNTNKKKNGREEGRYMKEGGQWKMK